MAIMPEFDYIVVGAGTAGCVIAARLSQRGTVILLEAGGSDTDPAVKDKIAEPSNVLGAITDTSIDQLYDTEPQSGLGGQRMQIFRGVVRGGCSSVNGMIYIRGNRRDYDLWAQLGNQGWSFEDVLPYFRRSENYSGGPSRYHGVGGPLDVRPLPAPSRAALAFVDAAGRYGFTSSGPDWDFNGPQQEGAAGLYQTNVTPGGRRASAAFAFLDGFANPQTLTTKLRTKVTRVVVERGRAVGVECLEDGAAATATYRAGREVIVSGGAFESPKLLMLSGIGPADQLRAHKVDVLADVPGVGENLHDHLQILIYHPTRNDPGQSGFTAEAGLFLNTRDLSPVVSPDLQYHVLAGMPGLGKTPHTLLVCPVLCRPQSRGRVTLAGGNPSAPPIIESRFLQCDADMRVLLKGIELAQDLRRVGDLGALVDSSQPYAYAREPRAEVLLPPEKSDWVSFVRRTAVTVWHPVGTCRMGRDDLAVVDDRLRVYGVEGLRVADASIAPFIPSGNTNAMCYMIGEMCADAVGG